MNSKEMTSHNRVEWLDIAKAYAIICVLIGHSIQYGSGSGNEYSDLFIDKFIYSFHLPLFMLISGYVFTYSVNKMGG